MTTPSGSVRESREIVRVDLGERSYDIVIGDNLLSEAGGLIAEHHHGARVAIVTDQHVSGIHLDTLDDSLRAAGVNAYSIITMAGESAKSWHGLQMVVDSLLSGRLERTDVVVALGGGVIGDLAGFAAAITRRGMPFVQVPTTLLSQVDSSVGGKTGISVDYGKNLVGAFHQPSLVIADTSALDTLPLREFRAGYAEVVKYGLIDDPDFFHWLETHHQGIFSGGPERRGAIAASCRAKARVVAADELESGRRALLNLGHTFGHAFEAGVGYDGRRLVHGEAVAIGMVLAFQFSARLGHASPADAERIEAHLRGVGLPTRLQDIPGDLPDTATLMERIAQDKKVKRGHLTFILAKGIGQSFIANNVPPEEVHAFLEEMRQAPTS